MSLCSTDIYLYFCFCFIYTFSDLFVACFDFVRQKEAEERNARKKREEEELKQKWDGVPVWKATIIRKREEIKKLEEERVLEAQRKEEEENARWENLPVWKRGIYQKKGLKPVNKTPEHINPSTTDSQVTRGRLLFESLQLTNHSALSNISN